MEILCYFLTTVLSAKYVPKTASYQGSEGLFSSVVTLHTLLSQRWVVVVSVWGTIWWWFVGPSLQKAPIFIHRVKYPLEKGKPQTNENLLNSNVCAFRFGHFITLSSFYFMYDFMLLLFL